MVTGGCTKQKYKHMKQIIVLSITIPILLVIMLQFSFEQIKHSKNLAMENALHEFRMASSIDFDNINAEADKLQLRLAEIYKVSKEEINIMIIPGNHEKSVLYSITIPVSKIMAGAEFMGLDEKKNKGSINILDEIFAIDINYEEDAQ